MYIRPVYVIASDVTEFRFVIVSHNNRSVMDETLDAALVRLFPGFEGEVGERIADPEEDDGLVGPEEEPTDQPEETGGEPSVITGDAAELVAQAEALYQEAQDLLREGDLGGYQAKIDEMGGVLTALADELDS